MGEKIVAVIGARLNSSRLPRKQLLPLAGAPMIEHIVRRLSKISNIDEIVLATTADDYNRNLVTWAEKAGVNCYAHVGDVDDLVGRIDSVAKAQSASILVYICGDSPLIEPSTIETLLTTLINTPKADWARMEELPEGQTYIHEGFALYRRRFWDEMVKAAVVPFEKEHVGAVFHVLEKVMPTSTAYGQEDPVFHCIDHRISVDTTSDYDFMRRIYDDWYAAHESATIVDLRWVINRLLAEPSLRAINAHVHQKAVAETSAKIILLTQADSKTGLGHLRRMTVAAKQLQDHLAASVRIVILGEEQQLDWLDILPHEWRPAGELADVFTELCDEVPSAMLLDFQCLSEGLLRVVEQMRGQGTKFIAVDAIPDGDCFDGYYIPCFHVGDRHKALLKKRLAYGWDSYLLHPPAREKRENETAAGNRLIVLTGGSDFFGLGQHWPAMLDEALPADVAITWVQGPYAQPPDLTGVSESRQFTVEKSPSDLPGLIAEHNLALSVYGVSFFECLQAELPTVVYVPENRAETEEIEALKEENVCLLANDASACIGVLADLVGSDTLKARLATVCSDLWGKRDNEPPLVALVKHIGQL